MNAPQIDMLMEIGADVATDFIRFLYFWVVLKLSPDIIRAFGNAILKLEESNVRGSKD
jgi:hypothetical protein